MAFVELIPLSRCRIGGGTFIPCDMLELAVFRFTDPDRVIVLDNACPHANGNLSGGAVHDGLVRCPWHSWEFNLDSGQCTHSDKARVRRYAAEIRNGVVWADIP
ncbi:MAG: Rieske 2Fe-2S domain-containing protein [Planctomycetota bacterium]